MLKNSFLIAWRNLRKNKLYSAINLFGLAIGLACCMSIGLFVNDELSYDRFHRGSENIYRVVQTQKQEDGIFHFAMTPWPTGVQLKKDFSEVEAATAIRSSGGLLVLGEKATEIKKGLLADPAFFQFFDFPLLIGNRQTLFSRPGQIVLSASTARAYFGPDWLHKATPGQTFTYNDELYTLAGVAADAPERSSIQFDILLHRQYHYNYDDWGSNEVHTYIRLKAGTDIKAFNKKIRFILHDQYPAITATVQLQPLSEVYLYSKFDFGTDWGKRSDILYVRIFTTVGIIILFIAIVNFVNLSTARAVNRAKEVGVRKTIGAKRGALIGQFLTEALLLTAIAVLAGLVLLFPLLTLLNGIAIKHLRVPFADPGFWVLTGGFTGVIGCLSGLYPAFYLSSFRPVKVLKGIVDARSGRVFWQSLVVGQFALSMILAIGAGVVWRQLHFIQNKKLGFDKSQLLYVRLNAGAQKNARLLKQDLMALPGVAQAAGSTGDLTDNMQSTTNVTWDGQPPKDRFLLTQMNVDADFFVTTGMTLASGRNFLPHSDEDTSSRRPVEYIINQAAAKRMGYTDTTAIGKQVSQRGLLGFVIGVVKDFHFRPLHVTIEPLMIRCVPPIARKAWSSDPWSRLYVRMKPGQAPTVLAKLDDLYKKYEPLYPLNFGFVDQDLDALYKPEQITGKVTAAFAMLAIFVSCLGLFGLATFTIGQRTKEIGIRKVLGASVTGILALLSKDFLKLIGVALIIAIPVALWATNRWLQDFNYRINVEWWIFAGVGLVAIGLALATVVVNSLKTAMIPAIKSLQEP
jgi:putative ABC transport system permease protein